MGTRGFTEPFSSQFSLLILQKASGKQTKDFLMFSGGSKGNIGKKWVKGSSARTISQSTRYLFQTIITEMLHKNYPKMTSNAKQNRQNRIQKDKKLVFKRISRKCRL